MSNMSGYTDVEMAIADANMKLYKHMLDEIKMADTYEERNRVYTYWVRTCSWLTDAGLMPVSLIRRLFSERLARLYDDAIESLYMPFDYEDDTNEESNAQDTTNET